MAHETNGLYSALISPALASIIPLLSHLILFVEAVSAPRQPLCVWGPLLSYVSCDGVCHYCRLPATNSAGPT